MNAINLPDMSRARSNQKPVLVQRTSISSKFNGVVSEFFFKFYVLLSRLLSQKVENNSIDRLTFELARGKKFSSEQ